jgi:class 3 adenylate cyclase
LARLKPLDRALLVTLLPLWAVLFPLHVKYAAEGRLAWLMLGASVSSPEDAASYPSIRSVANDPSILTWAQISGLQPGDRLVRIGNRDLGGVGPIGFFARAAEQASDDNWVYVVVERGGETREGGWQLDTWPYPRWWWDLPALLLWIVVGVLVLLRSPESRSSRALFHAVACGAIVATGTSGGPYWLTSTTIILSLVFAALTVPLILRFWLVLPDEVAQPSAWEFRLIWLMAPVVLIVNAGFFFGVPLASWTSFRLGEVVRVVLGVLIVVALARNYVRSGPVGRRRIKWIVFGVCAGTIPGIGANLMALYDRGLSWLPYATSIFALLVPICFLIAIVRYNLFDIDRLFSTTLSYSGLTIVAVATVLVLLPRVAETASSAVGIAPVSGQIALVILVVLAVLPAQRRLRAGIERVLFKQRHVVDQGVERLLADLTGGSGLEDMAVLTGERLDTLFAPESCVLYARAGATYAPVFQRGAAVPATFEANGPLVAALRSREGPLVAQAGSRREAAPDLTPFDRAALETLGAAVLLPIRRREELTGFVCLGPKSSGDVYTSTDVALLAAVGSKLSSELLRLDDRGILQDAWAMQERLRRYVPEPVVSRLAGGHELVSAEREVSVLFVDIRGHTSYAEARNAEQVFSMVNRFTETVSAIVRRHRGAVLEFSGDGLMAVFGATDESAQKERAAVEAGREMVEAVASLTPKGSEQVLSVGVGIATGPAFLGDVRAVDRLIWTAIGNTPNLAARLQALTRELGAAMVIDPPTWRGARYVAADFVKYEQMPIRGRSNRFDVYVLPLGAPAARAEEVSPETRARVTDAAYPSGFAGGRYRVQALLGEGASKRVYLARDTRLERDVAVALIKTEGLDEEGLARVRREVQAMGRLGDHPNIVTVHDVGDEGIHPFIVSEYMAGGSLDDVLQRAPDHGLPTARVLRIAGQLCSALQHAHAQNIIHRDLKPSNVWLTHDGTAKLGDFGLAIALDRSRLTLQGAMVGTVAYMAPEQALGEDPDPRNDLYSLGAMLYEMVTGRRVFLGDIAATITQHINTAPQRPSLYNAEVPRALEDVILRLLAKTAAARPASAVAVREALAGICPPSPRSI